MLDALQPRVAPTLATVAKRLLLAGAIILPAPVLTHIQDTRADVYYEVPDVSSFEHGAANDANQNADVAAAWNKAVGKLSY